MNEPTQLTRKRGQTEGIFPFACDWIDSSIHIDEVNMDRPEFKPYLVAQRHVHVSNYIDRIGAVYDVNTEAQRYKNEMILSIL